MAQNKAIQDQLLTNVALEYNTSGFVAGDVFPTLKTAQMSGKIPVKGRDFLRVENTFAGGAGKFRSIQTKAVSSQNFQIETHGLEELVTKADYRNYTAPFDAEKDTTQALRNILLIEKEIALQSVLTSTSVMTQNTTLAGNAQFSDYVNSVPVSVFSAARAAAINSVGDVPNAAIMDILVFDKLKYHPQFLASLGYTTQRPGGLTENELKDVLGIERLFVSKARYNTAKQGQTASYASVWGKDIVFVNAPASAQVGQMSTGYFIVPEGSQPQKVYTYEPGNPPGAKAILCEDEYDLVLTEVLSGYLVKAAIA